MPRCAIYARFSSELQSIHSCEDQVALCRARAEREGWSVTEVYTDVAISGTSNRRPGMSALLSDAAAGSFDIVCAEAIDRIARDQEDIAAIYKRLTFAGVQIHTLSDGKVDELHIGLKGTMSALYLKDLAEKIRRGQRGSVARSRIPGGLTYGYAIVRAFGDDGEPVRGLREIVPEQADVVRRVYAEFLAGRSPRQIAIGLNADGIPSPRGSVWTASSILGSRSRSVGILHNAIYAGRFVYNRVQMKRDPETRRRVSRPNPADERISAHLPELAIVSVEDWQAAQDAIARRAAEPLPQRNRPKHLLSGLVRCGKCGGGFAAINARRLGCSRTREAGTCDQWGTVARAEVERRVLACLVDQLLSPEAISLLVKTYHEEVAAATSDRRRRTAAIDKRIAEVDVALTRLVQAIETGAADFRMIREALAARQADRERLVRERAELGAVEVIALNPAIAEAYRRRVRDLIYADGTGAPELVTRQLRELVEQVTVNQTNSEWKIDVLTSLSGAVDLVEGRLPPEGSLGRSAAVVAKEGFEPPTPGL